MFDTKMFVTVVLKNVNIICSLKKKRSSEIREQLGICNINDKLTQYKINWRENTKKG